MSRTERTYYLIFGLYNLSWAFIGSMYALFLLSRGLDLFQMSIVPAVYWIVSFLFEVPTGAFADLAGRKTSFVLSCVVRMLAFAMYAVAGSFAAFLVAEFVDAVGSTLANGALDAWAVDTLRSEGETRPADRFFARAGMIARTAIITSGVAGGYLAQRNIILPWVAAAVAFSVTAVVAMVLMREHRVRDAKRPLAPRAFARTMRAGFGTVRAVPVLMLICGLAFAGAFAVMPMQMLWQPRIQDLTGEGTWLMGWIWAMINVSSLLGSALVSRLLGRFQREHVLAGAMLWRGANLAVAALAVTTAPVIAGIVLMELAFGLSEPVLQAWVNEHIPSEQRATVLSVRSMFLTLGGGAGLVVIGAVARGFGIPIAWTVSAAILALMAPGFLIMSRRMRRDERALAVRIAVGS